MPCKKGRLSCVTKKTLMVGRALPYVDQSRTKGYSTLAELVEANIRAFTRFFKFYPPRPAQTNQVLNQQAGVVELLYLAKVRSPHQSFPILSRCGDEYFDLEANLMPVWFHEANLPCTTSQDRHKTIVTARSFRPHGSLIPPHLEEHFELERRQTVSSSVYKSAGFERARECAQVWRPEPRPGGASFGFGHPWPSGP